MQILFSKEKLRRICNSERELKRKFGSPCARIIRRRLDDLYAADSLETMTNLPGNCHELKGDRKGQLSIDLEQPLRLIFIPANNPIPVKNDGGLLRSEVTAIKILEVVDTHE